LGETDGMSMWSNFLSTKNDLELNDDKIVRKRTSFLYNIDDQYNNSAVRIGPWKLIQGGLFS